jgi:hypothetical protein|tara:strand:+ start:754 stop:1023 length:270 start_codon:yes stop_codon:yes gene_type:complete
MTGQELITRANVHFGIDITKCKDFGKDGFADRCFTAYYAITELNMPYTELANAIDEQDRTKLRLMWLYAEGLMGVVQSRNRYKQFTLTL